MAITLKAARVNKNLNQSDVAKILGVTKATVGNWERGITYPNGAKIKALLSLYEMEYDNVIFLPDNYALSVREKQEVNK